MPLDYLENILLECFIDLKQLLFSYHQALRYIAYGMPCFYFQK